MCCTAQGGDYLHLALCDITRKAGRRLTGGHETRERG